jgi:cytochrome P450
MPAGGLPQSAVPTPQSGEVETSLASLDVELQPQGARYLFTTPRSNMKVTAQAVARSLETRVVRLAIIAVLATAALIILRKASSFSFRGKRVAALHHSVQKRACVRKPDETSKRLRADQVVPASAQ